MATTKRKLPYMVCYFNTCNHQLRCGITEKEFDVIEQKIRDEYGYGYAYKQPVKGHTMTGLISFGITQYGQERCEEGLESWTALNEGLEEQIWELIKDKTDCFKEAQERILASNK